MMKHKEEVEIMMAIKYFSAVVLTLFLMAIASIFLGCESVPVASPPIAEQPLPRIALSWENTTAPHPERAPWSDYLLQKIGESKSVLDTATDIKDFCPKYLNLSQEDQLKVWGEFFVALAYYESSWNPTSASVDVGDPKKRDTYSIGLFQVSVVDQAWAGGNLKYTYTELITAKPNIHLGMQLFTRQISKTQTVFLDNSSKFRYWAIILLGNRYQKIPEIKARVKKNAPNCF